MHLVLHAVGGHIAPELDIPRGGNVIVQLERGARGVMGDARPLLHQYHPNVDADVPIHGAYYRPRIALDPYDHDVDVIDAGEHRIETYAIDFARGARDFEVLAGSVQSGLFPWT